MKVGKGKSNGKIIKAIELLAEGGYPHEAVADQVGIAPSTLHRWKKDPEFMAAVIDRARMFIKATLPDVYKEMRNNKDKLGWAKLYLSHLENLEELNAKAQQGMIVFEWDCKEDCEDECE